MISSALKPVTYRFLFLGLLTFTLLSCTNDKKSELVKSLEAIFYSGNFTDIPETVFNAADYGLSGDGHTVETDAIQAAIDAAHEAGGGKVIFPEGLYRTGALFIKSNVEFHIGEGVTLQAIHDNSYYPEKHTRVAGIEMMWPSAIINVYDQENVRITGKGIIDGNGKYWWDKFWGDPQFSGGMWIEYKEKNIRWAVDYDCKRVRPVVVYKSKDVLLKDFTVQRAGFWTVQLTYSDRVHVDGLVIRNNIGGHGPSSDGIDTDSSKDILVENCDIDCNDDNLCIKSGKDADGLRVNRPAENIVYRNCITRAGHGLVTLGSETSGGMRNIEVYGLEAVGTNTGVRFKSAKVRGGLMENIWFHDIKMDKVKSPFHFELNWYPEYSYPTIPDEIPAEEIPDRWRAITAPVVPAELGIPEFKNIRLSNITATNSKEGFYANAYAEKPMNHFTWENVHIEAQESGVINHAADWTFENVTLKTQSGKDVEMTGCTGVPQPELIFTESKKEIAEAEILPLPEQIAAIRQAEPSITIIPVNLKNVTALSEGDTTVFSDSIEVRIFNSHDAVVTYTEPLGDGFYYSPVSVLQSEDGKIFEVKAQKAHTYRFVLIGVKEPAAVSGVDNYNYRQDIKQLTFVKTGINFTIQIQ